MLRKKTKTLNKSTYQKGEEATGGPMLRRSQKQIAFFKKSNQFFIKCQTFFQPIELGEGAKGCGACYRNLRYPPPISQEDSLPAPFHFVPPPRKSLRESRSALRRRKTGVCAGCPPASAFENTRTTSSSGCSTCGNRIGLRRSPQNAEEKRFF